MPQIEVVALPGFREPLSSFSHLLGAVVFAILAVALIRRGRGDRSRTISLVVMAVSTVQLLILSGVYHMFSPGPMRALMVRADVSGVFLLIAGSLTPVHVILFKGSARTVPLIAAWSVAIVGIILRMIFFESVSSGAGIALFLMFGWGAAVTAAVLFQKFGWSFVSPAVMSGLSFTVGAIALALHQPTLIPGLIGPHEVWHAAVLLGIGLHWRFVFRFASGQIPEEIGQPFPQPAPIPVPLRRAA